MYIVCPPSLFSVLICTVCGLISNSLLYGNQKSTSKQIVYFGLFSRFNCLVDHIALFFVVPGACIIIKVTVLVFLLNVL